MTKDKQIYVLTIDGITMRNAFTTVSNLAKHYPIVKLAPARISLSSAGVYLFLITEGEATKTCSVTRVTITKMKGRNIVGMFKPKPKQL